MPSDKINRNIEVTLMCKRFFFVCYRTAQTHLQDKVIPVNLLKSSQKALDALQSLMTPFCHETQ